LLVVARDTSMRRFLALLLRQLPVRMVAPDDQDGIYFALETDTVPAVVVVGDIDGWPGREVASVLRDAHAQCGTVTVFLAHEPPAPEWRFAEAFVCLPFTNDDLLDVVSGLLERRNAPQHPR
jgi:hypothetical protein